MNLKFARKVERYVGVPICFLLSVLHALNVFRLFAKKPETGNICFIELSEVGSVLLASSAVAKTKKLHPNAKIYFVVFEKNKYGIDASGYVPKDRVLTIRGHSLPLLAIDTITFMIKARKLGLNTMIDMELFSRYTAILSYLSGAKKRIGFSNGKNEGMYRGNLLTHPVMYNPHQHMSKNFLSLVYAIDETDKDNDGIMVKRIIPDSDITQYKRPVTLALKKKSMRFLKKFVSVKPGQRIIIVSPDAGALPIRAWPLDHFIALIKRLTADGHLVVIIGAGRPAEETGAIITNRLQSAHLVNLTGKTSFDELIGLFFIADVLITNDGGPAHFATLSDIHIVTFFGPETSTLYGPISKNAHNISAEFSCSPCINASNQRDTACKNNRCLRAIPVETVYLLTKRILGGNA